jgi:curli biogenesis system outer membrane secretion channel CsgG
MKRLGSLVLLLATFVCTSPTQQKKRVAVLNFDYATVQSYVSSIFGSNQDVGKGIADLLVDRLVSGGTYSVIERKALDKVLAEQNFSNSDRADATSAAKIGRVLGVDAIVIGSITQFGRDDKKTGVGGAGRSLGRIGLGGLEVKKSTAVVGITARMVDTSTAEILTSASAKGESSRSGTGVGGGGGSYAGAAAGALDMQSSNFANTVLGEATNAAVKDLAKQLEARSGAMPTRTIIISALVADAQPDGTVVINQGSRAGVKKGDHYSVKRKIREIKDPATGRVIRTVEDDLGSMVITDVDEQSAVGKFTGKEIPKVGDAVKSQ